MNLKDRIQSAESAFVAVFGPAIPPRPEIPEKMFQAFYAKVLELRAATPSYDYKTVNRQAIAAVMAEHPEYVKLLNKGVKK
jgi:hypothetical protein